MTDFISKSCDALIAEACETIQREMGADVELILDRLLTYAAAQMVMTTSKAEAAAAFRQCAKTVQSGLFDHIKSGQTLRKH
jgi:uncharacterized protein with PIN domain